MYSAVLMAALTSGAEAPQWGYYYSGPGCYYDYSCSWYGGCYGGYYPGYWGCYGYASYWGCYGYAPYWGYGWCGYYSPSWYYPVVAAPVVPVVPRVVVPAVAAVREPPPTFIAPKPQDPTITPLTEAEKEAVRQVLETLRKKTDSPPVPVNVARLRVHLPSQARLFVDNVPCTLTSATRSFNTPALEPGRIYFYTLRMEVVRGGQTVVENRHVTLKAGRQVEVDFTTATATASR